MAKKTVAVLDFGSSKLTMLVGSKSVNNCFSIVASSDIDYPGFMNGEFLDIDNLKYDIKSVFDEVSSNIKKPITKVYVAVPTEFCTVEKHTISRSFSGKVRLDKKKIDSLYVDADAVVESTDESVINISPIYYLLDDENVVYDPIDCVCRQLKANCCFVLAKNDFTEVVGSVLESLGVNSIEYICSALAEGEYLFSKEQKNNSILFVDCGYLTTTVAYYRGEGLLDLTAFPIGGGHITAKINEGMNIPFEMAEQVKQKLILTLKPTGLDYYEVYGNRGIEKVQSLPANELAKEVVDEIVENIDKAIRNFENQPKEYDTIYLTGGGISYLKGVKCYVEKLLGRQVEIVCPEPLKYRKPDLSGVLSLLDTALNME